MSNSYNFLPNNASMFLAFLEALTAYVVKNKLAWKIPVERIDELLSAQDDLREHIQLATASPTSANIHQRQNTHKNATRLLRVFINQFLRFPPITDTDLIAMGIPPRDTIRTTHFQVTENVAFNITLSAIRELKINFWIQDANHRAKPKGYDGAIIIWGIADKAPLNPEDLTHHIMASRTPFTLFFTEEERGKTVYIALAWQNERGIRGTWSEYQTAVVP